jgi:hypothetical protein
MRWEEVGTPGARASGRRAVALLLAVVVTMSMLAATVSPFVH